MPKYKYNHFLQAALNPFFHLTLKECFTRKTAEKKLHEMHAYIIQTPNSKNRYGIDAPLTPEQVQRMVHADPKLMAQVKPEDRYLMFKKPSSAAYIKRKYCDWKIPYSKLLWPKRNKWDME